MTNPDDARPARLGINPPRARSIRDIVHVVAEFYGLSAADILGRSRLRTTAEARAVAYCLARDLTRSSFPELGIAFGRDHTTIVAVVKSTSREAMRDEFLAKAMAECRARSLEAIAARRAA